MRFWCWSWKGSLVCNRKKRNCSVERERDDSDSFQSHLNAGSHFFIFRALKKKTYASKIKTKSRSGNIIRTSGWYNFKFVTSTTVMAIPKVWLIKQNKKCLYLKYISPFMRVSWITITQFVAVVQIFVFSVETGNFVCASHRLEWLFFFWKLFVLILIEMLEHIQIPGIQWAHAQIA